MKAMAASILAFYFLLAGLMPHMDFCDLSKIPDLVAHYLEHQSGEKEINLCAFIDSHYAKDAQQPADEHSLPFKDHNCCPAGHTLTVFSGPLVLEFREVVHKRLTYRPFTSYQPSDFPGSIWQPPQLI